MISEKVKKAREYQKENIEKNANSEYPLFHANAQVGWINDPNGFSVYRGEYHLFFQHYPYSNHWGPMHWGHVKTKDFIKWETLPIALAPDQDYDSFGCFSGGAVETPDGKLMLLYTGVRVEKQEDGSEKAYQQQCMAVGDGIDFEKCPSNPVISTAMIPAGNDTTDFRDPKIWRENDRYFAIMGNRTADTSGEILLYESGDGQNWKYMGVIDKCNDQYGKMWECPDYFKLDDKAILMVNPQEMSGRSLEYHPGNISLFIIGEGKECLDFKREKVLSVDYGLDFYAPQTLLTSDGRRVMIGWMQNWETSNYGNDAYPHFGEMTIPRVLEYRNGRVYQNPVEEITNYYGSRFEAKQATIAGKKAFEGLSGRALDMFVTLRGKDGASLDEASGDFRINLAEEENGRVTITYDSHRGMLELDRSQSGIRSDMANFRRFPIEREKGQIKLRILMDYHSLEIFINDGAKAASMKIYSPLSAKGISFEAEKQVQADILSFDLKEKLSK